MTNNHVSRAERTGQPMFSRTENRNDGNADQCREVHRSGVVREKKTTRAQLGDQLVQARSADAIHAVLAELLCDQPSAFRISGRPEKVPFNWLLGCNCGGDFGESFREPALRWTILSAGTEAES